MIRKTIHFLIKTVTISIDTLYYTFNILFEKIYIDCSTLELVRDKCHKFLQ